MGRTLIFQTLCLNLCAHIPDLRLWAASTEYGHAPLGWQMEFLNLPVRSPSKVVLEVSQDEEILTGKVHTYDRRAIPRHQQGPSHTTVWHIGEGHSKKTPHDCVQCGRELAACLQSLGVGVVGECVCVGLLCSRFYLCIPYVGGHKYMYLEVPLLTAVVFYKFFKSGALT